MDRKSYSKRRETNLWRIVDDEIISLRIKILRGDLVGFKAPYQEDLVYALTRDIADKVCAEYRKSYAPEKK
jgi:hypothetical protein